MIASESLASKKLQIHGNMSIVIRKRWLLAPKRTSHYEIQRGQGALEEMEKYGPKLATPSNVCQSREALRARQCTDMTIGAMGYPQLLFGNLIRDCLIWKGDQRANYFHPQ